MNKVKVSICIPCYNYAQYVGRAIESLQEQTFQDWELIVIENGSTDNSFEVISSYNDPRVRCIQIEVNDGPVPAWQRGLEESRGEWFGLLPADDYFKPEKLQRQMEWAEENPSISAIGGYVQQVDGDENPYDGDCWMEKHVNRTFDFDDLENWEWIHRFCIPTALYRTDLCRKAGAPTKGLCGVSDWDFHVRMMRCGTKFDVIPEVLTCYRWHGSNYSGGGVERAALEWAYSYATQYVPLLRELGKEDRMVRCAWKFFTYFDAWSFHRATTAAMLYALLRPDAVAARFSDYNAFRSLAEKNRNLDDKRSEKKEEVKPTRSVQNGCAFDGFLLEDEQMGTSWACLLACVDRQRSMARQDRENLDRTCRERDQAREDHTRTRDRANRLAQERDRLKAQVAKLKTNYNTLRESTIFRSAPLKKLGRSIRHLVKGKAPLV